MIRQHYWGLNIPLLDSYALQVQDVCDHYGKAEISPFPIDHMNGTDGSDEPLRDITRNGLGAFWWTHGCHLTQGRLRVVQQVEDGLGKWGHLPLGT